MIKIRQFACNPYGERAYVVADEAGAGAVIDPGFLGDAETAALDGCLSKEGIRLQVILLTHAHFDHIYGVAHCVETYGVPVFLHPDEAVILRDAALLAADGGMPVPDTDWPWKEAHEGDTLRIGDLTLQVIETPGHSPGSVSYYAAQEGVLFSGDTLFAGTIGNTQLRWGDYDKEIVSIMDKLMGLDGAVRVFPGHGGPTTIGDERTHNPFLQPFNGKDPETGWVDGIETR
ncbi:MAG: MBL fold metallo-hydrolase [Bacteroidales bacterium]|nr:MBL fold metallo-hydrolase [Bacteroidales bacterium]